MIEYKMPKMDHLSEESFIEQWLIKIGDSVAPGQIIMRIETGKAILEVEANFSGVLKEILIPEGEMVDIGTIIALFDEV